ncbi:diguanylate cyclase domain-containing protein [Deinococcus roseus]|uniref:Diguanylate cyclase n=1 Tax=Deinococcus roseus TaxID=392414 RepID=A0ABQ2D6T6_9DEIO|nr:diguanylate cyclase [Deinococcus roseus]GGJ43541.1 hypothetical protein GCM10008938_32280 [Deinococcus roseus]
MKKTRWTPTPSHRISVDLKACCRMFQVPLWLMTLDGQVEEISDQAVKTHQLSRENLIGHPIFVSSVWEARTLALLQQEVQQFSHSKTLDLTLSDPDGIFRTFQFRLEAVVHDGNPLALLLYLVSGLDPAVALQEVCEQSDLGLAVVTEQGEVVWHNAGFLRLLQQGTAGLDALQVQHFPELPLDLAATQPFSRTLSLKRGRQVNWLHLTGSPMVLSGQKHLSVMLQDVTAFQQQLARQQVQEVQVQLAVSAGSMVPWTLDVQSQALQFDSVMVPLQPTFSLTLDSGLDWIHPEDQEKVRWTVRQARSGLPFQVECRLMLPSGGIRQLKISGQQVVQAGREVLVGCCWDFTEQHNLQQELQEAYRIAQFSRWRVHLPSGTLEWNAELLHLLGLPAPLPKEHWEQVLTPQSWQRLQDLKNALQKDASQKDTSYFQLDLEVHLPEQPTLWLNVRGRVVCTVQGQPEFVHGTVQNITEMVQARQQMQALSRRLVLATETGGIGIWELHPHSMELELDPTLQEFFGVQQAHGHITLDFYAFSERYVHPDDQPLLEGIFRRLTAEEGRPETTQSVDFRVKSLLGQEKVLRFYAQVVQENTHRRILGTAQDITEQKQAEQRIRHQAHHDPLTDLPNRRLFFELLSQQVREHARTQEKSAVLFIDLDRFKEVNDTYGHQAGDQLLLEVTRRLRECTRSSDVLARLAGDEFVILLTRLSDRQTAAMIADRILHLLNKPVQVGRNEAHISASIGIALFPQDADDAETLMIHADQSMYHAKKNGKNQYHFFEGNRV